MQEARGLIPGRGTTDVCTLIQLFSLLYRAALCFLYVYLIAEWTAFCFLPMHIVVFFVVFFCFLFVCFLLLFFYYLIHFILFYFILSLSE